MILGYLAKDAHPTGGWLGWFKSSAFPGRRNTFASLLGRSVVASQALRGINTRVTPQNEQATPEQTKNSAGGYVFEVTPESRLRRFLVLGTDGGTYYTGERQLTQDNAAVVLDFARNRTLDLVNEVVTVSEAGRAPKNDPAVFALAAASALGDDAGRKAALAALPRVARTGTHLFQFAGFRQQFGGWGRGVRRAVANWYLDRDVDQAAYQMVKYRQREGWSHRDLLRLSHPFTVDEGRKALFDWACGRAPDADLPVVVQAFLTAQSATTVQEWTRVIDEAEGRLSWEMLPDAALNERAVWEALILHGVPQTALMRQLPRLTRIGVIGPGKPYTVKVAEQLQDTQRLLKARVHPVNVLVAAKTYTGGRSLRGSSEWTPVPAVSDALDAAFYNAFGSVRKTGKRHLLALDVSGSMGSPAGGLPISCREVTAAMALVTQATEPATTVIGFTGGHGGWGWSRYSGPQTVSHTDPVSVLDLSSRRRLDDAVRSIEGLPFGGTDCSLPATWAREQGHDFDAITIYTDNETWAGAVHAFQALTQYRAQVGHRVSQVVAGMTATNFTIADPRDPDSLDVVGMDSAVPNLIANFAAGDL